MTTENAARLSSPDPPAPGAPVWGRDREDPGRRVRASALTRAIRTHSRGHRRDGREAPGIENRDREVRRGPEGRRRCSEETRERSRGDRAPGHGRTRNTVRSAAEDRATRTPTRSGTPEDRGGDARGGDQPRSDPSRRRLLAED